MFELFSPQRGGEPRAARQGVCSITQTTLMQRSPLKGGECRPPLPYVLHRNAAGNELERLLLHLRLTFKLLALILGRSEAGSPFEQSDKRPEAIESDGKARFSDGHPVLEHLFRPFDSYMRQVLVRRPAIDTLERADEMELGITRLVRNLARVHGFGEIAVDEHFRLHDSAIKIQSG